MNLNQLQYFKILAQEEHYTRAAQMLSITQPSLSHAIAQLEEELGTRLFEKKGRNIVLTRYGKLFLPYVEESPEDDKRLGKLIQYMLEQNDIQVEWVTNGNDIYEYAKYTDYDILVLDWMMPGVTGVEACSRLRHEGYEKAILMLTARDSVEDRVTGLDAGADDYLVKPFEFAELLARLRALGRRSTQKIQQDVVEVGDFTLNRTAKVLKKKDDVIQLSPREFQIFDLLAQNIGIVVPRDIILDRIWGLESDVSSNNIDSYMKILRKKLDLGDGDTIIKTVRGVGYKLEAHK